MNEITYVCTGLCKYSQNTATQAACGCVRLCGLYAVCMCEKTKTEIEIGNRKQKLILAHYANPTHVKDQRLHQSAERQPHYLAKYSNAEHGELLSTY